MSSLIIEYVRAHRPLFVGIVIILTLLTILLFLNNKKKTSTSTTNHPLRDLKEWFILVSNYFWEKCTSVRRKLMTKLVKKIPGLQNRLIYRLLKRKTRTGVSNIIAFVVVLFLCALFGVILRAILWLFSFIVEHRIIAGITTLVVLALWLWLAKSRKESAGNHKVAKDRMISFFVCGIIILILNILCWHLEISAWDKLRTYKETAWFLVFVMILLTVSMWFIASFEDKKLKTSGKIMFILAITGWAVAAAKNDTYMVSPKQVRSTFFATSTPPAFNQTFTVPQGQWSPRLRPERYTCPNIDLYVLLDDKGEPLLWKKENPTNNNQIRFKVPEHVTFIRITPVFPQEIIVEGMLYESK